MKTKVQNSDLFFLQDHRLSLAAKGLLMYFIVNPEERFVSYENWVLDTNNSVDEIKAALEELRKLQYVTVIDDHIALTYLGQKHFTFKS